MLPSAQLSTTKHRALSANEEEAEDEDDEEGGDNNGFERGVNLALDRLDGVVMVVGDVVSGLVQRIVR